jgi:hypothetical protein
VQAYPFDTGFLRDVAAWSARVAMAAAVVGAVFTRDWRFPLSVGIGAAVDIGVLELAIRRGEAAAESGLARESLVASGLVASRLLIKGLLLVVSVLLPALLNVWGMIVGVLVFDVTVMTVGSVKAAVRVSR